jgi:hypothetical protein
MERTERRNGTKYEPVKEPGSEDRLLEWTGGTRMPRTFVAQRSVVSAAVFLAKLSAEFTPFF